MRTSKSVLVTGGAGFIGNHLCRRLLDEGVDVVCVDNFFTGQKQNIFDLMDNNHFELIRHDIVNPLTLEVDEIYNLACPASPIHYQYNPIKTIKMGTVGMVNMLGLAKRTNARILQASTSEVYGDPKMHPQREDYWGNVNTLGPRSCYDEGKRVAESLMLAYHMQHKLDIRIARIFNTYGSNMAIGDGRVVSNFIIQALKGENLTVYGDGLQTRSFCYVDDLVDGLVRLMNMDVGCGSFDGPVNLGNPVERTMLDFAEIIIELTDSSSKIVHKPLPQDDPVRRCPDISKAKASLGWEPHIGIDEGLRKTIKYFRGIIHETDGGL